MNISFSEKDVENVQKRWKQLRDCYIKSKRKMKEYLPRGSAARSTKNAKSTFRLYEQMKFLDDVLDKSVTVSSLPENTSTNDIAEDIELVTANPTLTTVSQPSTSTDSQQSLISEPTSSPSYQRRASRKSKSDDNSSDIRAAICSALDSESIRKDAVDGFLLQIGDRLRALPIRERYQFEIQILSLLFELEQKLISSNDVFVQMLRFCSVIIRYLH
ncbi:uncharacterized protein [Mycetomoellerius zeteki]|uniref:uncharacterized protein n=1 Tax=Mycetomoellerius zeteki TaxID=64791 RepID=UPI00084EA6E7|nr:PREDICTED: uncharacterized protein LOC108727530 [Trachymyrmex zeteki]